MLTELVKESEEFDFGGFSKYVINANELSNQ